MQLAGPRAQEVHSQHLISLPGLGTDLPWIGGLFLGVIFLASGALKLVHLARFRDTLAAMEVLPRRLTAGVSWSLPLVEILLGAAAVAGWRPAVTGPMLLGLLLIFLLALARYRLRGGKELACGCFADLEQKTATWVLMLRNTLLLAVGLPVLLARDPPAQRGLETWLLAATVVLGGILAWLLASRLVEIVATLRAERRAVYS